MREYVALRSITYLPFKNLILSAADKSRESDLQDQVWTVPRPLMEFLESNHNESQMEAIRVSYFIINFFVVLSSAFFMSFCSFRYTFVVNRCYEFLFYF